MPTSEAAGGARVAFVVTPGDEVATLVAEHARRLGAAVVATGEDAGPVDTVVAVGTRAARAVADADGPAARILLLHAMDDRELAAGSAEARAAIDAFTLPWPVVTTARWIADQLAALRVPGAPRVATVRLGVAKGVPASGPNHDGPLRVLVADGDGGGDEARAAAAAMREPHAMVDDAGDADVVLALPRTAGIPLGPLRGFHAGATAVMTAVTGHDEYVVDGVNALLTAWDDERGTSRLLDLLARDRDLLRRLRDGARATAAEWPTIDEGAAALRAALTND